MSSTSLRESRTFENMLSRAGSLRSFATRSIWWLALTLSRSSLHETFARRTPDPDRHLSHRQACPSLLDDSPLQFLRHGLNPRTSSLGQHSPKAGVCPVSEC